MGKNFSFIAFAIALAGCGVFAALLAWWTDMNFWILAAISLGAVLVNGLVADIEDRSDGA